MVEVPCGLITKGPTILTELDSNISEDVRSLIKELCSAAYRGDSFDNEHYNELISYVQAVKN